MTTFTLALEYVEVDCGHKDHGPGGFSFAMTRTFYDETRRTGRSWYCPLGHCRAWRGKTTETQLEESRARETALRDQLSAAIRDAEQTRAALLHDRARFAAGVCPCCNRSFENVRRHMRSQHPDYDVTRIDKHAPIFKCSCGKKFESYRGLRTHQGHRRETSGDFAWDKPGQGRYFAHLTEVKV